MPLGPALTHLNKDGVLAGTRRGTLGQWLTGKRIVVSRALCSHERVKNDDDLSKTNQLKRAYLHALEKSPFSNPGVFLKAGQQNTTIWSWDSDQIKNDSGGANIICVPESAYYADLNDGFYVIRCIDGYEGLYCKDKEIVLSRWWAAPPKEADWLRFTLNAEQFGAAFEPQPSPIEMTRANRKSTPRNALPARELLKMADISRLVLIGFIVLLLATLYPVGRWVHLSAQSNLLSAEIEQLTSQFDEQLNTMREQNDLAQSIYNISNAVDKPSIFLPFSSGVYLIGSSGGTVQTVTFVENSWEIGFIAEPGFDETELVRVLEASEELTSASVIADRRDNNWIARFEQSQISGGTPQ